METADFSPSQVTISKFKIANEIIFTAINWLKNCNNSFHMILFKEDQSWTGQFSLDSFNEFANLLNMSSEEYAELLKVALLNNSSDYLHEFKASSTSASFMWVKNKEQMKILHGSVCLLKDEPAKSKDIIIEALLLKNSTLKTELDDVQKVNHNLLAELSASRNELQKYANWQSELERVLYGKFIQLLNTKKERIKVLEGLLNKYES